MIANAGTETNLVFPFLNPKNFFNFLTKNLKKFYNKFTKFFKNKKKKFFFFF